MDFNDSQKADKLDNSVKALISCRDELYKSINSMESYMNNSLNGKWRGDSKEMFMKIYEDWKQSMNVLIRIYDAEASMAKNTAGFIKNTPENLAVNK